MATPIPAGFTPLEAPYRTTFNGTSTAGSVRQPVDNSALPPGFTAVTDDAAAPAPTTAPIGLPAGFQLADDVATPNTPPTPTPAGFSSMNPDEINAKYNTPGNTDFPSPAEMDVLYGQHLEQMAAPLSDQSWQAAKGIGTGIVNTVKSINPITGLEEEQADLNAGAPAMQALARVGSSEVEGVSGAASGLVGGLWDAGKTALSYLNPISAYKEYKGEPAVNDPDAAAAAWKQEYLRQLALSRQTISGSAQMAAGVNPRNVIQPYPALAATINTAASIPMMEGGIKALSSVGGAATGFLKRGVSLPNETGGALAKEAATGGADKVAPAEPLSPAAKVATEATPSSKTATTAPGSPAGYISGGFGDNPVLPVGAKPAPGGVWARSPKTGEWVADAAPITPFGETADMAAADASGANPAQTQPSGAPANAPTPAGNAGKPVGMDDATTKPTPNQPQVENAGEVSTAGNVAAPTANSVSKTAGNLPVLTPEQESQLADLGYASDEIAKMMPEEAQSVINGAQLPGTPALSVRTGESGTQPGSLIQNAIGKGSNQTAGLGARILSGAGQGAAALGGILKTAGSLPRKALGAIIEPVTSTMFPAEAAPIVEGMVMDKASDIPLVGNALKLGTAGEALGSGVEKTGTFLQQTAEADQNNPWGRLFALSKNTDAPQWLRSWANYAGKVANVVQPAVNVAKNAAIGGGIGAAQGALTGQSPEEVGEDIGSGLAFGGMVGGLGAAEARRAAVYQRQIGALNDIVQSHLSEGVTPETLSHVPDAAMLEAGTLEKMGIRSKAGTPLKVRFVDGDTYNQAGGAKYQGSAAFHSPEENKIYVNADKLTKSGAWGTLYHEAMHPLFDSEVANRPELRQQIDAALAENDQTLDEAKQTYVRQLIKPQLAGINDSIAAQRAVNKAIAERNAMSAQQYGDENNWIYSEIMAEAGKQALAGKGIANSVDPSLTESLMQPAVDSLQALLGRLGVTSKPGIKGGTVLPGFENVITDPSLRRATYKLLQAQKDFLPGMTKIAGAPEDRAGAKIGKNDWGNIPGAPLYDLGNGQKGNDFVVTGSDGRPVPRPASQVRRIIKGRQEEMNGLYPQNVIPKGQADNSPTVALRRAPSGRLERSGTQLGPKFYDAKTVGAATKGFAKDLEGAIANGESRTGWYQQIGKGPDWKASVGANTGAIEAQLKDFVPYGFLVDKQGNVLVRNYSLGALDRKAQQWQARKGQLSLEPWGGDITKFKGDVQQYFANHAQGLPGDANNLGQAKRDVINAFVMGDNRTFDVKNPLRAHLKGPDRQGIIRSYRLDRLQTMDPYDSGYNKPDYLKQLNNFTPAVENEEKTPSPKAITPDQLHPALLVNGKPVTGGSSHADILQNTMKRPGISDDEKYGALEAFTNDKSHVFVDNTGKVYSRAEAAQALGQQGGLQSHRLAELQAQARAAAAPQIEAGKNFWNEQAATEPGVSTVVSAAKERAANFSPEVASPPGKLENAADDLKSVPLVHLSSNAGLKEVNPKFFGRGRANTRDLSGGAKSYFFVKGSPLQADENVFGQGGYHAYNASVLGKDLYDLRPGKPDTLNYFKTVNREEADDNVKDAGYKGIIVGTADGRQVVQMYKPTKVTYGGPFKGATAANFSPTPDEGVRKVADDYMKGAKLPYAPYSDYRPVNEQLGRDTADFYEAAEHDPDNPEVKASYAALSKETADQWRAAQAAGMKFEPWTKPGQPYANSAEMAADVKNNHLWYFPTSGGFGEEAGESDHPMLAASGIKDADGNDVPVNDAFRAIHDYFGHAKEGYGFGPRGEYNAFLSHARMFSDEARPAMAAETMGQNSWVNFGEHLRDEEGNIPAKGEPGFKPLEERPFAEQKATVLPDDLLDRAVNSRFDTNFSPSLEDLVKDTDGKPKVFYHGTKSVQPFDKFEQKPATVATIFGEEPVQRTGYFFTDSKALADTFGKRTTAANLSIKSTLNLKAGWPEKLIEHLSDAGFSQKWLENTPTWELFDGEGGKELVDQLKQAGYDSAEIHEPSVKGHRSPGSATIVFDAENIHPANGKNFSPSPAGETPSEDERAPVYYSKLKQVVDSKFSGKEMPSAQLAAVLRKPENGVKADELKWSGLDDFLKSKPRVSRDEVQKFLTDNQLQVKEIQKGENSSAVRKYAVRRNPAGGFDVIDRDTDHLFGTYNSHQDATDARERAYDPKNELGETKFDNYQLPGGDNYREILFQLPRKEATPYSELRLNEEESEHAGHDMYDVIDPTNGLVRFTGTPAEAKQYANEKEGKVSASFKSSHWNEPNVLAHTRLNDRPDADGKPGLFAEEIQSDWHQEGRKIGYGTTTNWVVRDENNHLVGDDFPTEKAAREAAEAHGKSDKWKIYEKPGTTGIPDAPYKTTWHELVFRRLVRMAADEGKDWLGWTTGEQQAERYDLSKHIDSIAYKRDGDKFTFDAIKDSSVPVSKKDISIGEVEATLGKEIAQKMLDGHGKRATDYGPKNWRELEGVDLKIGGEGMKGFYDKILVDYANKFGKKFGAKVEDRQVPGNESETQEEAEKRPDFSLDEPLQNKTVTVHSLPITPEMKKSVQSEGVALFSPGAAGNAPAEQKMVSDHVHQQMRRITALTATQPSRNYELAAK